jgi:hypothetical protein
LSGASPAIGGFVFVDKNNNGLFNPGESPMPGAHLVLLNASGAIAGTATTGSNGFYAFFTDASPAAAPVSVTQTLVLPAGYTNIQNAPFGPALQLFAPSSGTLLDVKVSSKVTVSSELQAENTSSMQTATISGSISGSYQVNGLDRAISGTLSAATPVFHATTFDGKLDYAGTSGVTFPTLTPSGTQSATLSAPFDLAFFTASAGRTTVTPTASVSAALQFGASTGNTEYQAATKGSAVVTVTYDYIPTTPLKPGRYTVVEIPTPGYIDGKTSQNGVVLHTPFGTPWIAVNLTAAGSVQNNFGLLPAPSPSTTLKPAVFISPVVPNGPDSSGFLAYGVHGSGFIV